jgi:hypothetical protein
MLDFTQPVAIILWGTLDLILDTDQAQGIAKRLLDAVRAEPADLSGRRSAVPLLRMDGL